MEPKDIVRRLYSAFAEGDVPAVLAALDPEVRWTEAAGFPYAGTHVGPDAVLHGVFARLGGEWDGFAAVPEELVAEGDTVVALGTYSGVYKASGKRVSVPFAHVWKLRDDKVVTFHQHTDTAVVQAALR